MPAGHMHRTGLMALSNLGSNARLEGIFQLDYTSGHAMILNSRTGKEGSPVFSLNCDRSLHSGIRAPDTVMSTDGQIIELGHMHRTGHCSLYAPGSADRLWVSQCCQVYGIEASARRN